MKGTETPEQLKQEGFSLIPIQPKGIPKKNQICETRWATNGKSYYKITKMTKSEQKCFDDYKKRYKSGKEIFYQYEPFDLFLKYPINIKAEKDKYGNILVKVGENK